MATVSLIYGSRVVDSADAIWTASANVTASAETTTKKKGAASAKLAIAAGFATGIAGYKVISAMDMTAATQIRFWVRSSISLAANKLQLHLDTENTFASPPEALQLQDLTANTWEQQTLSFATPANLTAITHIGLYVVDDQAAFDVYLDDIVLVSETKSFDALYVRGLDAPDDEDCYPDIESKRLLDGSWKENYPSVATRNIEVRIVTSTYADYVFCRHWLFAQNVRQITYDGETIDVVRIGSNNNMEWLDGFHPAKGITLNVREKTARALNTIPSSWNN
jgi:hypothetical protein